MKSLLHISLGIFLSIILFHDKSCACNAYGGYGFFEPGHPHMHMGGYHGGYNGYGYNGFGGMMDPMLRTEIGNHRGRSSLIPISRHRHVHRLHRRAVHSRRSPTTTT